MSLQTPLLANDSSMQTTDGSIYQTTLTNHKVSQTNSVGFDKASHNASLRAGAMLGQMCERSLIEHQLAACYFAVRNFCEHAPARSAPDNARVLH